MVGTFPPEGFILTMLQFTISIAPAEYMSAAVEMIMSAANAVYCE
jgi:hypothetical protein